MKIYYFTKYLLFCREFKMKNILHFKSMDQILVTNKVAKLWLSFCSHVIIMFKNKYTCLFIYYYKQARTEEEFGCDMCFTLIFIFLSLINLKFMKVPKIA